MEDRVPHQGVAADRRAAPASPKRTLGYGRGSAILVLYVCDDHRGQRARRREEEAMKAGINAIDKKIALELRKRLAQGVQIEDFRVYGSRARGEATPDSDLDVYLVVTELTPALRRWIDEIAWEIGFEKDRVISTLVTTRRGLEQGPFGAQPVVRVIEREGISL